MVMAETHPEAMIPGTTPIDDEGVPDRPWRGDRCTGSHVDISRIVIVTDSLYKSVVPSLTGL